MPEDPVGSTTRRVRIHAPTSVRDIVGVAAIATAAVHVWWVAAVRSDGPWNPDEAHYLAQSLRLGDQLRHLDLGAAWTSMAGSTGPVSIVAGGVTSAIGGRSAAAATAGQALLAVATAVVLAVAVERLAGRRAGLVAGVVVLGLPLVMVLARTFSLAPGVTLGLALVVLGFAPRPERERPESSPARPGVSEVMTAAGVALVLLARPASVAFVPAIAVAGLVAHRHHRPALRRWATATAAGVVAALPWWWANHQQIVDYLTSYGFGKDSSAYGSNGIVDRVAETATQIADNLHTALLLVVIGAVGAVLAVRSRRRAGLGATPGLDGAIAVVVLWALATAALLTSRNRGWLVISPTLPPLVAAGVIGASRLGARVRRVVGIAATSLAALSIVVSATDPGGPASFDGLAAARTILTGPVDTGVQRTDPRMDRAGRATVVAVARSWADVSDQALATAVDIAHAHPGPTTDVVLTVVGSCPLVNAATIELAAVQRYGRFQPPITGARTRDGDRAVREGLSASVGEIPRVLIGIRSGCESYHGDEDSEDVLSTAAKLGWHRVRTIRRPDGGSVDVFRRAG